MWLWCGAQFSNVRLHRFVAVVWCSVVKCMPAQVCGCGVVLGCQIYAAQVCGRGVVLCCQIYACTGLWLWCGVVLCCQMYAAQVCGCGVVLGCQMYACTILWLWCGARLSNVCLHRFVAVV